MRFSNNLADNVSKERQYKGLLFDIQWERDLGNLRWTTVNSGKVYLVNHFALFFRTIEPDVVGERISITDEEKPVLYQLEKERRQKVWEYRPGVEIPKVWLYFPFFFFAHYGCLKDIFCTYYERVFMYVMDVLKTSFKRYLCH